jgi:hypothetical protein
VDPVDPIDPVDPVDPVDPAVPEGSPTVGQAEAWFEWIGEGEEFFVTHYVVQVSGAASATVRAQLEGSGATTTPLAPAVEGDAVGHGTVALTASLSQLCGNAAVDFAYVNGDTVGTTTTTTLWSLAPIPEWWLLVCAITHDGADPSLADVATVDALVADEPVPGTEEATVPQESTTPAGETPVEETPAAPAAPGEETPAAEAPATPVAPVEESAPAEEPAPVEESAPVDEAAAASATAEDTAKVEAPADSAPTAAEEPASAE